MRGLGTEIVPERAPCSGLLSRSALAILYALGATVTFSALTCQAQLSYREAIDLAVNNSPKVKIARDDVRRASAALDEARDYYIPVVDFGGGLGRNYGITLSVPTIFTINSQSLIYNPSQRDYIRSARLRLESSKLDLENVRQEVEEDAAITYASLATARERRDVLAYQADDARELWQIVKKRRDAGLDSELEVLKAQRTLLQVELQEPKVSTDADRNRSSFLIGRCNSSKLRFCLHS
jgi:outer membrane protein TolC